MRTTQQDLRRTTVLTTLNPVPSVTGNGVFSDGTPYSSIRTALGQYDIYFDPRLVPISGSVGPISVGRWYYIFEVIGTGNFVRVQVLDAAGAGADRSFDLTITCLDTRT